MDPSTPPPTNDDSFAIGTLLSLTTTFNETFECQVITYDRPSNILVLQEGLKSSSQSSRRNIRLLKANYIKEFTFLGQSADDPLDLKKCFLDLNSLQSKEEAAVRQAEIDVERIGVGVTAEAQSLFDALSKTCRLSCPAWLPVRWDKTAIVVMNEVRVSSPYLAESVTGGTPAANERVRKVIELERRRLQTRGAGQ
ncbi:protein LSM12 [Tanacetum coccineum]